MRRLPRLLVVVISAVALTLCAAVGVTHDAQAADPPVPDPAPTHVAASPRDGAALVTWRFAPAGGAVPLAGPYPSEVVASPGGAVARTADSNTSSLLFPNLTNGTTYRFKVRTQANGNGYGPFSALSAPITVGAPERIVKWSAASGDRKLQITCIPATTNGSAITGYRVIVNPGGRVQNQSACNFTFANLTNGTTYTVELFARNARGLSPAATKQATPQPGSITVLSPNGGETWTRGASHTVTLQRSSVLPSATMRVQLLRGDAVVATLATNAPVVASQSFVVPTDIPAAANYRVRLIVNGVPTPTSDTSDATFKVA